VMIGHDGGRMAPGVVPKVRHPVSLMESPERSRRKRPHFPHDQMVSLAQRYERGTLNIYEVIARS
jgi:hypothetical protein